MITVIILSVISVLLVLYGFHEFLDIDDQWLVLTPLLKKPHIFQIQISPACLIAENRSSKTTQYIQ